MRKYLSLRQKRMLTSVSIQVIKLVLLILFITVIIALILYMEASILGKSLSTIPSIIGFLKDSAVLSVVESIAIITSLVVFSFSGWRNQQQQQRYASLALLDASQTLEKSVSLKGILIELNHRGESFQNYSFKPETDLQEIQLPGVNFRQAKLPSANLVNACLKEGNFWSAQMENANLQQATLKDANFNEACLEGVNFSRSILHSATFKGANLKDCIFDCAEINKVDFTKAKNLPINQIVLAEGWKTATFDEGVMEKLNQIATKSAAIEFPRS
jgi:Pentapeptide repeats (9 copies)/Pentapeptide repeats (8 copies)